MGAAQRDTYTSVCKSRVRVPRDDFLLEEYLVLARRAGGRGCVAITDASIYTLFVEVCVVRSRSLRPTLLQ